MRSFTIIFLLLVSYLALQGQNKKKINYQLDFGATYWIPYENRIAFVIPNRWHVTNYHLASGFFLGFSTAYCFNNRASLCSGMDFYQTRLKIFRELYHHPVFEAEINGNTNYECFTGFTFYLFEITNFCRLNLFS